MLWSISILGLLHTCDANPNVGATLWADCVLECSLVMCVCHPSERVDWLYCSLLGFPWTQMHLAETFIFL